MVVDEVSSEVEFEPEDPRSAVDLASAQKDDDAQVLSSQDSQATTVQFVSCSVPSKQALAVAVEAEASLPAKKGGQKAAALRARVNMQDQSNCIVFVGLLCCVVLCCGVCLTA